MVAFIKDLLHIYAICFAFFIKGGPGAAGAKGESGEPGPQVQ